MSAPREVGDHWVAALVIGFLLGVAACFEFLREAFEPIK